MNSNSNVVKRYRKYIPRRQVTPVFTTMFPSGGSYQSSLFMVLEIGNTKD